MEGYQGENHDTKQPTIELLIQGDRGSETVALGGFTDLSKLSNPKGDNPGDNQKRKLKALVEKEDSHVNKMESEIKVNSSTNKCASVPTSVTTSKKDKSDGQINWQSYPHDSSSEKRKKERAEKVKERILGCSTSNELIELKISEREIDWLKKNVLTQAERKQVKGIELTRQGNLFSLDAAQEVVDFDFNEVMSEIDEEMRRLNWSRGEGKDYLVKTYGVKSRHRLNDEQLIEFWNYLKKNEQGRKVRKK